MSKILGFSLIESLIYLMMTLLISILSFQVIRVFHDKTFTSFQSTSCIPMLLHFNTLFEDIHESSPITHVNTLSCLHLIGKKKDICWISKGNSIKRRINEFGKKHTGLILQANLSFVQFKLQKQGNIKGVKHSLTLNRIRYKTFIAFRKGLLV